MSRGPLAGLRVVEIAGIGPSPYAALVLAELGADVVRVDRPGGVQGYAAVPTGLGRSRPSVAVDLKDPRGVEVVARLADDADVLLEGLRPGAMERLGLGPDVLLDRNPRLVYGRMTGWGQD
ncbi:MAG: CoA transferase, partial [Phycicoccus sp.]